MQGTNMQEQGLVHKEQSSMEITSREKACRIQMCRKQGTIKHRNNQQVASMQGMNVQEIGVQCARNNQAWK